MRAVNLARRPFVNRQPVLRLAGLLWLIGVVLLLINVKLYSSYWSGSADYRQRLTDVGQEVQEAQQLLNEHNPALAKVNLSQENARTKFLNSLISYRTFPWSALFDDLEDVVPIDVRLTSVRPAVQLVVEPPKPRRRRAQASSPRRSTSRGRAVTAAETTEAAETTAQNDETEPAVRSRADSSSKTSKPSPSELRRNEVMLDVVGVARTQEALMEFIDTLYASSSFRQPFLPGEVVDHAAGSTNFSINVIYLTQPPELLDDEEAGEGLDDENLADEDSEESDLEDGTVLAGDEEPASGEVPTADSGPVASLPAAGTEVEPVTGPASSVAAATETRPARSGAVRRDQASRATEPAPSAINEDDGSSAVRQAESSRASRRGRSNTGRSNTGRSNTGRSATGRTGLPPGLLPPGSVPVGNAPTTAPAGAVPPTGQSGAPAGRLPGAPPPAPGFATPPASATPRLQSGSLMGTGSAVPLWEAIT